MSLLSLVKCFVLKSTLSKINIHQLSCAILLVYYFLSFLFNLCIYLNLKCILNRCIYLCLPFLSNLTISDLQWEHFTFNIIYITFTFNIIIAIVCLSLPPCYLFSICLFCFVILLFISLIFYFYYFYWFLSSSLEFLVFFQG